MLGGYQEFDGTVEFYSRIASVLEPAHTVLDLGAGRGAWFFEDRCESRKSVRDFRCRVARLIGADVDPVVLTNPTTTENLLIVAGHIPLPDASVDVIVADYVLEHINDVVEFAAEVNRVLKPGGYLCARTPHKYCYVSIAARLVRNSRHSRVLSRVQPGRKAIDVFPTAYRLNTLATLAETFPAYEHYSYLYVAEPQYFFGSRVCYRLFSFLHRVLPRSMVGNIFIFIRKAAEPGS